MAAIFEEWFEKEQSKLQGTNVKKGKRRYLHFDTRIGRLNEQELKGFLYPARVAQHSFFPFVRIYKKVWEHKEVGGKKKVSLKKNRPIDYASHKDSLVYSWYAFQLQEKLETEIKRRGLNENMIAYRSLEKKTNIDFAHEVFSFLAAHEGWVALTFDVKKFFESIDHDHLRRKWSSLMGLKDLPPDHRTVYRGITRFSYVRKGHAFEILGISDKGKGMRRMSSARNFRKKVVGGNAITKNAGKGIPQGAAISCVLSNIYMLELDTALKNLTESFGGMYRRYSDDIAVICPPEKQQAVTDLIYAEIGATNLTLQAEKSEQLSMERAAGKMVILDLVNSKRPTRFRYLGLEFDGENSYLRHAGIARFQRRRTKSIQRLAGRAEERKHEGILPRKQLYERFLGKKGNYIAYGLRVDRVFNSKSIRHQIYSNRFRKQMKGLVSKMKLRMVSATKK